MLQVIVAIVVLLSITLIKSIPKIGGSVAWGLVLAGAITLIISGNFEPVAWLASFIDGLDRLAWISALAIVGGIMAEISVRLGTVDTIIGTLNAKFGRHPRSLVVCIVCVLCLSGSLLGDATASAAVVGALTFAILASMGIELERVAAIILMGCAVGSIMPPMTQAIALASTLVDTDPDPVVTLGYFTVSIVLVVACAYSALVLVKKDNRPGLNPDIEIKESGETAGQILRKNWKSLLPMIFLVLVVICRTVPAIKFDLGPAILKLFTFKIGEQSVTLYDFLSSITVVKGLTNGIVMSILCAIIFAFLMFPSLRKDAGSVVSTGLKNVWACLSLQLCCAFMIGTFYYCGSIEAVTQFAIGLDANVMKIGGTVAMCLIGMLTGSQSTTQNSIFSFFGPALVATGTNPTYAALAGANLAAAGQGMPPADLCMFVICGMMSAQLNKKVNPVKAMLYSFPMCFVYLIIGVVLLYI